MELLILFFQFLLAMNIIGGEYSAITIILSMIVIVLALFIGWWIVAVVYILLLGLVVWG